MTRPYHSQSQETVTMAAAARALEVHRRTFAKWVTAGYVKLVEVGPAHHGIRRVPVSEVERLKRNVPTG